MGRPIRGNITKTGTLNALDASLILSHLHNIPGYELSGRDLASANVKNSDDVSEEDTKLILKHLVDTPGYEIFDPFYNNFDITFLNSSELNDDEFTLYKNEMLKAIEKWDSIINGVSNENLGTNFRLAIRIDIASLDSGILGQANIEMIYDTSNYNDGVTYYDNNHKYGESLFPYSGFFNINVNYVSDMYYNVKSSGLSELYYVTLHEIGHVLGIGILWSYETPNSENTPIISNDGTVGIDLYYTGTNALREYRAIFKDQTLVGMPIENNGGGGTIGGHIEEGTEDGLTTNNRYIGNKLYPGLDQELMTGWAETYNFDLPLSRVTIGLLEDIGYNVDYGEADDYEKPKTPWAKSASYSFLPDSSNNNISFNGQCLVDNISLLYEIVISNMPDLTTLGSFYDDGDPITSTFSGLSNQIIYTPTPSNSQIQFTIYYRAYYIDLLSNEQISSNLAEINIYVGTIPLQSSLNSDNTDTSLLVASAAASARVSNSLKNYGCTICHNKKKSTLVKRTQEIVKPAKQEIVKPAKQEIVKPAKQEIVKPAKQEIVKTLMFNLRPAKLRNHPSRFKMHFT